MYEKLSKKVLVIDDEQVIVDGLVKFFGQNGYHPTVCMNADEALSATRSGGFDLIISDVTLGTANGQELCRRIHELENANVTPVIFLSGTQVSDIIRRSRSAGGTYYVRKPFDPEVLSVLLETAM